MLELLFSSAWKSAVLMGAAWLASLALRRSAASLRYSLWILAVSGTLCLPPLIWLMPRWDAPVVTLLAAAGPAAAGVGSPVPPGAWRWLAWLWAAGAAAVLVKAALAELAVRRIARGAHPAAPALQRLSTVPVLESEAAAFPFTCGWLRQSIVLPRAAREWPVDRLRMVLAHESAHAARRDCLAFLPARLACALHWFNPLVWWAAGRVVREREQACDDRVLAGGASQADFASHLLAVARDASGLGWAAAHAAHTSQLEGRLLAILRPAADRSQTSLPALAALAVATLLVLVPLGAATAPEGKVYRTGKDGVTAPSLVSKVEPEYTPQAKDAKIEGTVVLNVVIETDGVARNIRVTKSLDSGLDSKAVEAVGQWRFKPGTRQGKPVRVRATIEVNFRLM